MPKQWNALWRNGSCRRQCFSTIPAGCRNQCLGTEVLADGPCSGRTDSIYDSEPDLWKWDLDAAGDYCPVSPDGYLGQRYYSGHDSFSESSSSLTHRPIFAFPFTEVPSPNPSGSPSEGSRTPSPPQSCSRPLSTIDRGPFACLPALRGANHQKTHHPSDTHPRRDVPTLFAPATFWLSVGRSQQGAVMAEKRRRRGVPDWPQEFKRGLVELRGDPLHGTTDTEKKGNPKKYKDLYRMNCLIAYRNSERIWLMKVLQQSKEVETLPVLLMNCQWSREQKWNRVRVSTVCICTFRRTQIVISA